VCDDYADAQDADGAIPDTVPYRIGHAPADPVCIAPLFLPLLQHRHFGRTSEVVRHLPTMRGWVGCLLRRADAEGILSLSHYGDWSPPSGDAAKMVTPLNPSCPGPFISTAFLAHDCRLLARACKLAGLDDEAARWLGEHRRIATAFRRRFVSAAGVVGSGSQSCLAVALGLDLLEDAQVPVAVAALATEVRQRGHLTTGNIATRFLLEVLSDHGHHDLALMLATRRDYPSWGYMLDQGATTLWERWEGGAGGDMNSHSHPMLGSYQSWLYERLAGLMVADDACAADHLVIRPGPGAGVTRCAAHLDTPRGRAAVDWRHEGSDLVLDLSLPGGTSAEVCLPDGSRQNVTSGGRFTCRRPAAHLLAHRA
jgi:alpha-L-rhamnosidase